MSVERDVLDRLDRLGLDWYVTGSWALAAYAEPRMTQDIDIVLGAGIDDYERRVRPAFETDFLVNDATDYGGRWMGGLIHMREIVKVDLMFGRADAWARSAWDRRAQVHHPSLGRIWVITAEDLVLAKLEWSHGISEVQMRDVRSVIRLDRDLDWSYLERYAAVLGIRDHLEAVREVDQAQARFDVRLREVGAVERMRTHEQMYRLAFELVWAQADRAGPMTELERARFLLRRLYPDFEGPRLESIMERLTVEWQAGTWTGFVRPR